MKAFLIILLISRVESRTQPLDQFDVRREAAAIHGNDKKRFQHTQPLGGLAMATTLRGGRQSHHPFRGGAGLTTKKRPPLPQQPAAPAIQASTTATTSSWFPASQSRTGVIPVPVPPPPPPSPEQRTHPSSSHCDAAPACKPNRVLKKQTVVALASVAAVVVIGMTRGYFHVPSWVSSLFNKEQVQARVVQMLQSLRHDGSFNSVSQCWRTHSLYALGIAAWQFFGLNVIPVETAAGMVMGWAGVTAGICGKLVGASLAFFVGRRHLRDHILKKFSKNPTCQLLLAANADGEENQTTKRHYCRHPAWLSAILMKFSILPETCRTLGTAVFLPNVSFGWFFGAAAIHSVLFTTMLTSMGVAASHKLGAVGATAAATTGGQLAMIAFICMNGVAPLTTAWWIQDLRKTVATSAAAGDLERI